MNKTKIKNFSVWARRDLIGVVAYRMRFLGIDENGIAPEMDGSTDKLKLYDMGTSKPAEVADKDIAKRVRLANHIREHEKTSDYKTAYETVVEEIAYTWFNRLIAIRFMEVNDYLPSGVRVLSSESGKREPDIVTYAAEVADAEGFSIEKDDIWKLKDENKLDELFRIMFIEQCKKLHKILPELFDNSQDDYTEMLLPISFIDDDAFIRHLVTDIDEADFDLSRQGQVEIIGWLYQYYNSEKKDAVFESMKKNVKVSKENIPAATQLFTPHWIVKYMVENSLGRLWADGHADTSARSEWKYYLEEAEQTPDVQAQLAELRAGRKDLPPEQIRFIDPCMGSGHILVYAFDVLMQIYLSCGYTERDAVHNITHRNLWGLDLDKRAYQLAYFAVMMKARQYDRRLWKRIEDGKFDSHLPNLSHFQDLPAPDYDLLDEPIRSFVKQFENADTYGSLITVQADDSIDEAIDNFEGSLIINRSQIENLMQLYKILSQKYDVVCTNPPYMGGSGMNAVLSDFVKKNFADYKSDLFSAFVVKCSQLAKPQGYLGFLTPYVWMFIQSYEKLRNLIYSEKTIETLIQFEYSAFEESTVPICTFVLKNSYVNKKGCYFRLTDFKGGMEVQRQKALEAIADHKCGFYYESNSENFSIIPGSPVAYWLSKSSIRLFNSCPKLGEIEIIRGGLTTGDNNRFLRLWYEVNSKKISFDTHSMEEAKISTLTWFPLAKGGDYRKWYGNLEYVVNWKEDGAEIKWWVTHNPKDPNTTSWSRRLFNTEHYFKKIITWSGISSGNPSMRIADKSIFGSGAKAIVESNKENYILAFLNSTVALMYLKVLSPTLNYESGHISSLPILVDENSIIAINKLVKDNLIISKADWDSFETSWDFKKHPFIRPVKRIKEAYEQWAQECEERFRKLRSNEEELNRIFIDIYGLQEELTPEVDDKDVTVRRADTERDCKSFISYAVGCLFGRYSLDADGLTYAGGEWDDSRYKTFIPDDDNCIPITEESFFEDDIVGQFVRFVSAAFGEECLEENLRFIADNIGIKGSGTAREKLRGYFLKDFFKDHCRVYQKRPIYWLFDTGKNNGFKALVYIHRWTVNTVGDVRIDYMHKLQRLYRNEINRLKENIDAGEEIAKNRKRLEKITNQLKETEEYDAKIGIVVAARTRIDLDDGVKVNYDKVQVGSDGRQYQILAKI